MTSTYPKVKRIHQRFSNAWHIIDDQKKQIAKLKQEKRQLIKQSKQLEGRDVKIVAFLSLFLLVSCVVDSVKWQYRELHEIKQTMDTDFIRLNYEQ